MEREVLKYEKLRPRKQSNESARVPKRNEKRSSKKLKKVVDKLNHLRYTNKAVARERRVRKKSAAARHLENYIVQQQTSQLIQVKLDNKKRNLIETTKRKKKNQSAGIPAEID